MLAKTHTATPWGIDALAVEVEVDAGLGLPQVTIVGLADAAVRESRERVRSALRNSGFDLPPRAIVISLSPADLRKEGNHFDLAIAVALLAALGQLPPASLEGRMLSGELGLDGTLRPVRGALAFADLARQQGCEELILPAGVATHAALMGCKRVLAAHHLSEVVAHLRGGAPLPTVEGESFETEGSEGPDLADVKGQALARRALEVAAAGGHNLLLIGPPGSGKTMLARRLPGLLPPLGLEESLEVTKLHNLASDVPLARLVRERPFRSPHASTSLPGLIGGGSVPRPGEVSLAHHGVLFLDELPEFRRDALEALRQPLEDGEVLVARARQRLRFPASFMLVVAQNPCHCGHLGDPTVACTCSPAALERYRSRVSGPLLDRIDLHVEVPRPALSDLRSRPGESTREVRERVLAARRRQQERLAGCPHSPLNARLTAAELAALVPLSNRCQDLLDRSFERLGLTARALDRVRRVARTLADLAGRDHVEPADIAEAIQFRAFDRRLR